MKISNNVKDLLFRLKTNLNALDKLEHDYKHDRALIIEDIKKQSGWIKDLK